MLAPTLKRLFNYITVETKDNIVTISGLPANTITADIKNAWNTSRVNSNLFIKIDYSELTFYNFFALEVYYTLELLLEDPKVRTNRRAIRKVMELLEKETWLHSLEEVYADIVDFKAVEKLNVKLLPSQNNFLRDYNRIVPKYGLEGLINGSEAGTGKTYALIALAAGLKQDINIILCPLIAVKDVWVEHLETAHANTPVIWNSADGGPIPQDVEWVICHYAALDSMVMEMRKFAGKRFFLGIDESHNFNELSAQRTQTLIEFKRRNTIAHSVVTSATFIKITGRELLTAMALIDPLFTPEVEKPFTKLFGLDAEKGGHILRKRIGLVTFKALKKDIMTVPLIEDKLLIKSPNSKLYTLSAITEQMKKYAKERLDYYAKERDRYLSYYANWLEKYAKTIHTRVEEEKYALYRRYVAEMSRGFNRQRHAEFATYCNQFERDYILPTLPADVRKAFKDAATVIKYVALKVQGEVLGTVLHKARIGCFKELVMYGNLDVLIDDADKKTIIFTSYVEIIQLIDKQLKAKAYQPVLIYANSPDSGDGLNRFRNDENINPLVATFKSLSTAITLTQANLIINVNTPYRSYESEQSVSRAWRNGQTHPVRSVTLILDTGSEPNISTRAEDILAWGREQLSILLGDVTPDVPEDNGEEEALSSSFTPPAPNRRLLDFIRGFGIK